MPLLAHMYVHVLHYFLAHRTFKMPRELVHHLSGALLTVCGQHFVGIPQIQKDFNGHKPWLKVYESNKFYQMPQKTIIKTLCQTFSLWQ
eukprot:m.12559 g.12559  ORF g.12559 m.12559 type:complete len:89 (-) comp4670_c0_seq1:259-525(-)